MVEGERGKGVRDGDEKIWNMVGWGRRRDWGYVWRERRGEDGEIWYGMR